MTAADVLAGKAPWAVDCADALAWLQGLPAGCADACVTDPPYGLSFMGKDWDRPEMLGQGSRTEAGGKLLGKGPGAKTRGYADCIPGVDMQTWHQKWATATLRALKPGAYLLAFGGSRTYHRLTCAIEDAGFEIRDCLLWLHGQGFPKGPGCLKPSYEPIVLARKPGKKVLPLGIDACRVPTSRGDAEAMARCNSPGSGRLHPRERMYSGPAKGTGPLDVTAGRYPANICHDGSDEVLEAFAAFGEKTTHPGTIRNEVGRGHFSPLRRAGTVLSEGDTGTAARFFFCAKASREERGPGNGHPTVKPLALCRWLVRLACPPDGLCLDPFTGSGTGGVACREEDRRFAGCDISPDYCALARRRIAAATPLVDAIATASGPEAPRQASLFPED